MPFILEMLSIEEREKLNYELNICSQAVDHDRKIALFLTRIEPMGESRRFDMFIGNNIVVFYTRTNAKTRSRTTEEKALKKPLIKDVHHHVTSIYIPNSLNIPIEELKTLIKEGLEVYGTGSARNNGSCKGSFDQNLDIVHKEKNITWVKK